MINAIYNAFKLKNLQHKLIANRDKVIKIPENKSFFLCCYLAKKQLQKNEGMV